MLAWDQAFFRAGTFEPDPSQSAEVNRGAYLVQGLGHCGACHNGRGLAGNSQVSEQLQGGKIQDWYAPNLTSDVHEGIGRYSDAQLVAYLKTGLAPGMGVASGPMAETIHDSLSKLTDADLHAMAAYLKSTKPETNYAAVQRSDYTGPVPAGRETYLSYCSSCHQPNGQGIPGAVAALAGNGAVLAGGPQNVIRTVLGGIEAKQTESPMPAIGQGMTDQEIADVTNYVRQAWGNTAPPNAGPGDVAKLRESTDISLYGARTGDCPAVMPPEVAAAVANPNTGIAVALQAVTQANILQTVEQIVPKVKAAAPHAQPADIVNGLTLAFCPAVRQDANTPEQRKPLAIGQFSVRVYSEIRSNGKD
jgi:mono/diheme cytochrome c family protein